MLLERVYITEILFMHTYSRNPPRKYDIPVLYVVPYFEDFLESLHSS
jgi:hypothetical protein